jgi:hypothetical protein
VAYIARAMERLPHAFARIRDGEWFCVAPLAFETPLGRVATTPGVTYRRGKKISGFDIAEALDVWRDTGQLPAKITLED